MQFERFAVAISGMHGPTSMVDNTSREFDDGQAAQTCASFNCQQEDSIMLDINKHTHDRQLSQTDPDGNLFDLDHWSPLYAQRQAKAEGIYLSDEHWEVIYFLRERYRVHGGASYARKVLGELEEKFGDGKGRRHLYELFPGGPVSQASRLAGLPLPPHSSDPSFGSVE
jgi:tRNA 2-thiouridine synthesizing protein E